MSYTPLNVEPKHKAAMVVGFVFLITGLVTMTFLHNYLKEQPVSDFGANSFLFVIGFSQFFQIRPVKYPVLIILAVVIGALFHEGHQYFQTGLLDSVSIAGSLTGGIVSLLIFMIIRHKYKSQEKQ